MIPAWKVSCACGLAFAPLLAPATPLAIETVAAELPERGGADVSAMAQAHLGKPLEVPYETAWWHLVFYRWCEIDRPAAGAFAQSHAEEFPDLIRAVVAAAHDQDATAAGELASALGEDAEQLLESFRPAVVVGEEKSVPDAGRDDDAQPLTGDALRAQIAEVMGDNRSVKDRINGLGSALEKLAEQDPEEALAQVEALAADDGERQLLLAALTKELRGAKPEAAARVFDLLPTSGERSRLAVAMARNWASDDPGSAQLWADTLPAGPERDAALAAVASGRASDDPLAVIDLLDANDWRMGFRSGPDFSQVVSPKGGGGGSGSWGGGSMQYTVRDALGHLIDEGQASEAMANIARIHDSSARRWIMGETLEKWVEIDPSAAVDWMAAAPPSSASSYTSRLSEGLAKLAADGDIARATRVIDGIADGSMQQNVAESFVRKALDANATASVEALATWAANLPDDRRGGVQRGIVSSLADADPARAAEFLSGLDLGDSTRSAWDNVAREWVDSDPGGAGAYLRAHARTLPDEAFATTTKRWMESAPREASGWVLTLPQGSRRDAAIDGLIDGLSSGSNGAKPDFESALIWAGEIGDPARGQAAIDDIVKRWQQADPSSAPTRQ